MKCPQCDEEVSRMRLTVEGWGCGDCLKIDFRSHAGQIHQVRSTKFGRLTEADAQRIKTNKKREDGRWSPDPRWK